MDMDVIISGAIGTGAVPFLLLPTNIGNNMLAELGAKSGPAKPLMVAEELSRVRLHY